MLDVHSCLSVRKYIDFKRESNEHLSVYAGWVIQALRFDVSIGTNELNFGNFDAIVMFS